MRLDERGIRKGTLVERARSKIELAGVSRREIGGDVKLLSDPVVYEFGDDMVHGGSNSAHGEVLHVRKRSTRESLVRAREHWLPELFRGAEKL